MIAVIADIVRDQGRNLPLINTDNADRKKQEKQKLTADLHG